MRKIDSVCRQHVEEMSVKKRGKSITIALVGVFLVFTLLVPVYWTVSSESPDGLDTLLEEQNVQAKEPVYSPPLAELQDYGATIPLYIVSGILGALIVLAALVLIVRVLKRKHQAA